MLQVLLLKQYRTSSLRYSGSDSRLVLQEEVPRPTKSSGQDPELLAQLSSSQGVSGSQERRPEDTSYDQVTNFKFVADILGAVHILRNHRWGGVSPHDYSITWGGLSK